MSTNNQFSEEQRRTIEEKVRQLQKIIDGTLNVQELANSITQRRLAWLKANRNLLRTDLQLPEATYRLIVYDHMRTEGEISIIISGNLLRAEARGFCPYLEACKELKMDTRFVCREIGEPSLVAFVQEISPALHFSRDYDRIRPYHDCCVEFVELRRNEK